MFEEDILFAFFDPKRFHVFHLCTSSNFCAKKTLARITRNPGPDSAKCSDPDPESIHNIGPVMCKTCDK